MNVNDLEKAIGQRLLTISPAPNVAWPNKDYSGAVPYVEFRHVPNGILNETIDGSFSRMQGIFLLTVVTERDKFTADANTIAWSIVDAFTIGLRLPTDGGGGVVVSQSTDLAPGFVDGIYWRQPVRVFYTTAP